MATTNPIDKGKDAPGEKEQTRQPRPDDKVVGDVTEAEVEAALAAHEKATKQPPAKQPGEQDGEPGDEELVDDGKGGTRRRTHAERRDAQRRAAAADKAKIADLEAQNLELNARVGRVEGRTAQNDRVSLEQNIANAAARQAAAREAKRAARAANDVEAEELAEEALYQARKQSEVLAAIKARVEHEDRAIRDGAAGEVRASAINPRVKELAGGWIARNQWYDTTLRDEDSKIAFSVDAQIKADGYDPQTPEYYQELDKRLKRRLPHRFTKSAGGDRSRSDADGDDDAAGSGGDDHGGGSPTGGSTRESAAGGDGQRITVPKEYIQALKDAGYNWDDPEVKKRMTARYIQERKNILAQQTR